MESTLKEDTITIRPFEQPDIDAVWALEKACPELAHWERKDYQDVAEGAMEGWVAIQQNALAGFIVIRQLHHEVEILNLAVTADGRRKGTGGRLLQVALDHAAKDRAVRTFLEVRMSNDPALKLYQRHGFKIIGRRVAYYHSPKEDALTLATGHPAPTNSLGRSIQ